MATAKNWVLSISERIAVRKLSSAVAKTTGVILFCSSILGCAGRATVEQVAEPPAQIQSSSEANPDTDNQAQLDWPGRMYINNMGGILGADAEKYQQTKDSLPAEFYDRLFVLHQRDGLNHIHLVRPYSSVYPNTGELEEFASTLVAISSSGQPSDYVLETSDILEILIADHPSYQDSRSAVIPFSKAIPLGGKKLPTDDSFKDLYLAGDTYMVMDDKHLMIRVFAAGDMIKFREIVKPMYVLSLKEDTLLVPLKQNKNNNRRQHPYTIAQAAAITE